MSSDLLFPLVLQILAGVALAACCGLRAFLPPFLVGLAARFGLVQLLIGEPVVLNRGFEWLSSTPALIVFGVATLFELAADKAPIVDHALDVVQTFVRPLAGAVVLAATLTELDPLTATVVGLVAGGTTAASTHVLKSKVRVLSTLGTGGLGSPVLSTIEDVIAFSGSVLALLAGVVAAALILAGVILTLRLRRRYVHRVRRLETDLET